MNVKHEEEGSGKLYQLPSNSNLEDLVKAKRTSIKVVGTGGAGNNDLFNTAGF